MNAFEPQKLLPTLPLQIANQMADSIVEGRFPPGSRLRETELALSFAVSRATIREALRLLEQRKLVKIQPQRGAHVTRLSAKELDDLFEVRASLLGTGSRLAAARCTPVHAKALRGYLKKLHANLPNLTDYAATSADLVEYLMRMSENEVLIEYIRDFAQRIGRYVRLGLATMERRQNSLVGWQTVIDAVIGDDGETADQQHRKLALQNRAAALEEFERQNPSQATI